MKYQVLPNCGRLQIRPSSIEGYGVFATDVIRKGEILEEVPFVVMGRWNQLGKAMYDRVNQMGFLSDKERYADAMKDALGHKAQERYYFQWSGPAPAHGAEKETRPVIALGNGSIYNSRNCGHNATFSVGADTVVFTAERDIAKDEEICTFFGYFMGEGGQPFECADVFNLAIDAVDGRHRLRALTFRDRTSYEQAKSSPSFVHLSQILSVARDGVVIHRLGGCTLDGIERAAMDIPPTAPLSFVYQNLRESRQSAVPVIKVGVRFTHKDTGVEMATEITFSK